MKILKQLYSIAFLALGSLALTSCGGGGGGGGGADSAAQKPTGPYRLLPDGASHARVVVSTAWIDASFNCLSGGKIDNGLFEITYSNGIKQTFSAKQGCTWEQVGENNDNIRLELYLPCNTAKPDDIVDMVIRLRPRYDSSLTTGSCVYATVEFIYARHRLNGYTCSSSESTTLDVINAHIEY